MLSPSTAATLLFRAARNAGTLNRRMLGGPGSGNFGHGGRPGEVGGSSEGGGGQDNSTKDLGFPSDDTVRTFDENDADSPEWKTLIRHDSFLDKLDEAEESDYQKMNSALTEYRGNGYQWMNRNLIQDPELLDRLDSGEEEDEDGRPSGDEPIKDFSDLLGEAPRIKEPITVYRGTTLRPELTSLKTGDKIVLNGFQSASFDPLVAQSYNKGVLFEIRANQGLAIGHAHSIKGEMEFVMDHGLHYRVVGQKDVQLKGLTTKTRIIQLAQMSVLRGKS